ncbi:hypothetical protein PLICRDRAFT_299319 [Plicaturopsis crispa FD-325 SS-3]|nr:hypothetical protein PLICRDRAFT_299319 [Plicaturopsis crispa FD-325 SS-3]
MPDVVDVDAEPEQEIQILRVHRPGRKPSEAIDVDTASVHDSELQLRQFLHRAQKAKAQETQGQRAPQGPVAGPSNHNIIPRRSTHKTAQSSKPPVRMNQSVGQTQHADSPLREPHPQIIELSDGDNDSQPPPAKKVRKRFTPSSDDEYDTVHAGFDIKNDSIRSTSSDDITSMLENTSISTPNPSVVKPLGGPIDYPVSLDIPGSWIWTQERLGFPRPKARNLTRDLHYDMLKQISSFRHVASSSINKIAQNGPLIAACSCTVDGFADFEDDSPSAPSPYNKPGSLFSIHGNDVNIIEGHSANIPRSVRVRYLEEGQGPDEFRDEELFETKYYTVNDVQFVPHWPAKLVSSGDDCHVCLWEYNNFDEDGIRMPPTLLKKVKYKHVPIDLKYRPGVSDESPLAVTCKDGYTYIHKLEIS